jgi:hypothetical protein
MAPRGEITLTVTFGPASTPVFHSAVAHARTHAQKLEQMGSKTYRASFVLGTDPDAYGRAMDLVHMVYGWRATLIEVDGSPEMVGTLRPMLHCAREWLRRLGRCADQFPAGPHPRCHGCALYDPEWALESFVRPTWTVGEEPVDAGVPDHVPEEWTLGGPGGT